MFQYFKDLDSQEKLPEFEDLEMLARKLYRAYSTTRGVYRALYDDGSHNEWSDFVPLGTCWSVPPVDPTSIHKSASTSRSKTTTKHHKANSSKMKPADTPPFKGDRTLGKSIALMRDFLLQREMAYATAEGDVGRVYEIMKVSLNEIFCVGIF